MQAEALIPLASGSGGGALAHVVVLPEGGKSHQAKLDPRIAELMDVGLYKAGMQGLAAARHFRLGSRRGAFSLVHARVTNPGDAAGLTPDNAGSAELGIALAFLAMAAGRSIQVLASGKLQLPEGSGRIPVSPIHHLGTKLEQIRTTFAQPGRAAPPASLFVPTSDPDGTDTLARYESAILALQAMGVRVHAIASLHEAVEILGIGAFPRPRWQLPVSIVASVAALGLLGLSVQYHRNSQPLELSFGVAAAADGRVLGTPLRIVPEHNGASELMPSCQGAGGPAYPIGQKLAFKVRVADAGEATEVGRVAVVTIGYESGAKVVALPPELRDAASGEYALSLDVLPPVEAVLLAVMAWRREVSLVEFEGQLRRYLEAVEPGSRLSAARNWLKTQAQGYLEYRMESVAGGEPCA